MKKISTAVAPKIEKVEGRRLTVGLDLVSPIGSILLETSIASSR